MAEENKSFFLNYKFVSGFVLGGLFIQLLVLFAYFVLTEHNPALLDNLRFNDAFGWKKKVSDGIYKNCEQIPNTNKFTTPYLRGIAHDLEKSIGNLEEIENVAVSIWLEAGNEKIPQGTVIIKFAKTSEGNEKLGREIKEYVCRYVVRLKKENLKLSELKDNS